MKMQLLKVVTGNLVNFTFPLYALFSICATPPFVFTVSVYCILSWAISSLYMFVSESKSNINEKLLKVVNKEHLNNGNDELFP